MTVGIAQVVAHDGGQVKWLDREVAFDHLIGRRDIASKNDLQFLQVSQWTTADRCSATQSTSHLESKVSTTSSPGLQVAFAFSLLPMRLVSGVRV